MKALATGSDPFGAAPPSNDPFGGGGQNQTGQGGKQQSSGVSHGCSSASRRFIRPAAKAQ